ncbi:hypothetical protein [Thermobaculum terrenum]|uniref:hypothetical protein n=1 Tax=Thermobaculum terrenum TaxID=166501 RepID=UPI00031CE485|nr:hypothetical protein [Thermobaculum terrenum]
MEGYTYETGEGMLYACPFCWGSGLIDNITCPECEGKGHLQGQPIGWTTCPNCQGQGTSVVGLLQMECPDCGGTGLVPL